MDIQQVKQRFGIIGNSPALNRALSIATQVAPTDMNVLITGESGTGKENMPKVIHHLSARKHATYIAVNCGAIPEGTIDSELFGHEKGSFTGAHDKRKGYFEEADGGTIFLDEVAELPTQTQVRLLRVLETGEFLRVGSSKPIKTDVRVVAATNENLQEAIASGKFREDLFYRLSSVPIHLPALRERNEDIHLLFRKFASEFAEKYRMPTIRLDEEAVQLLTNYNWPGNIRQLKNTTEQISIIEQEREITAAVLKLYLPELKPTSSLPMVQKKEADNFSERDILYKVLFDMKKDLNELKKLVLKIIQSDSGSISTEEKTRIIEQLYEDIQPETKNLLPHFPQGHIQSEPTKPSHHETAEPDHFEPAVEVEESLSLEDKEKELISKALEKHRGKRKYAAQDLGISERTLYRKIKEYDLND
ncbi:sigma-54-dependent Fis family transcriptional regulator [Putridiphycobacter roseus]|uniref:Sigma-54-dependent Fis family transcriptional regulator n=1 Tax=Putridiphycobacter roseus TaxID=2219161 RepID=A0A2W1N376_9FLAO|nr:sigma-54 dependent transcriptional regulator [Putridiphycobacter roseus]PZE18324.1 sigma-54-dependent Fis family transcriptional regulator [Putridiphycobacter roseus]